MKRRAYRNEDYWGRPIPPFGAANPRLLVVGLAPGAHGANRTGRIFTGDSSGDWLFRELYAAGFANQPESRSARDGLRLIETTVTCAVRCAPPQNRPNATERDACLPYLAEELQDYRRLRVVLVLGRFAFDALLRAWREARRCAWQVTPSFGHGNIFQTTDERVALIASYHPSRQNTQTGRLTRAMFREPFALAHKILERDSVPRGARS